MVESRRVGRVVHRAERPIVVASIGAAGASARGAEEASRESMAELATAARNLVADLISVPSGAGAGKVLRLGRLPVNVDVSAYYNVVKPDIGPGWTLRLKAAVLLPTSNF